MQCFNIYSVTCFRILLNALVCSALALNSCYSALLCSVLLCIAPLYALLSALLCYVLLCYDYVLLYALLCYAFNALLCNSALSSAML
jgi:hypothetical protein